MKLIKKTNINDIPTPLRDIKHSSFKLPKVEQAIKQITSGMTFLNVRFAERVTSP
jgi:hypothetical protein